MKSKKMTTREQALRWWNNKIKNPTAKEQLTDKYHKNPSRNFNSLTGLEIENIWVKEHLGKMSSGIVDYL